MTDDKNLKDLSKLLIIGLVIALLMFITTIKLLFTNNIEINYFLYSPLSILAISLALYLNWEYKNDYMKQLEKEKEKQKIKI